MKIVTVIGTRPQLIKAAQVSNVLRKKHNEIIINTGQHYDKEMFDIFLKELNLPKPDYSLDVGSGLHGEQTAKMLLEIEKILIKENPDLVIVYGDTNSTLSGALAAAKLHISLAHIESGCRSFDKTMPEEINRILTDHISDFLFCVTEKNVEQLKKEGIEKNVFLVGDVMYDSVLKISKLSKTSNILKKLKIKEKEYCLATIHRAENTDNKKRLSIILESLSHSKEKIILPLHPRTKKMINKFKLNNKINSNVIITQPLGYLDFQKLEINAKKIITDSGGVQKEAYYFKVPCITLRESTEWTETVEDGWNILVNTNKSKIMYAIKVFSPKNKQRMFFGVGNSAKKIVKFLSDSRKNYST